jgi:hypothetical protein
MLVGMADLLELVLELVCDLAGWYESWRLGVSFLATLGLAGGLYWAIPNSTAATIVAAPVLVAGLVLGFVWDRGA